MFKPLLVCACRLFLNMFKHAEQPLSFRPEKGSCPHLRLKHHCTETLSFFFPSFFLPSFLAFFLSFFSDFLSLFLSFFLPSFLPSLLSLSLSLCVKPKAVLGCAFSPLLTGLAPGPPLYRGVARRSLTLHPPLACQSCERNMTSAQEACTLPGQKQDNNQVKRSALVLTEYPDSKSSRTI